MGGLAADIEASPTASIYPLSPIPQRQNSPIPHQLSFPSFHIFTSSLVHDSSSTSYLSTIHRLTYHQVQRFLGLLLINGIFRSSVLTRSLNRSSTTPCAHAHYLPLCYTYRYSPVYSPIYSPVYSPPWHTTHSY